MCEQYIVRLRQKKEGQNDLAADAFDHVRGEKPQKGKKEPKPVLDGLNTANLGPRK